MGQLRKFRKENDGAVKHFVRELKMRKQPKRINEKSGLK